MMRDSRALYFINAPADYACIGGLSIALYAVLEWLQRAMHIAPSMALWSGIATGLVWIGNWPHFAATSYRLYHTKSSISQYPVTAIVVPFVMVAAIVASLASPDEIAPYFVKLYLIWSPYHYSGQSVGISLIYARRAGWEFGRVERMALSGFIFGTFLYPTALSEAEAARRMFYAISYPTLRLPPIVSWIIGGVMVVSGIFFLACLLRRAVRSRRLPPGIMLLPAIAQCVWFVVGSRNPAFNVMVPFFHGLQYLLIAWAMQLKESVDAGRWLPSPRGALVESLRWGTGIFAGGAGLFWLLPRIGMLAGFSLSVAEPVIIAAVQIHHFFVDGVIWKLKNPRVGSPLLVNIEDLVKAAPKIAVQPA